MPPTSLLPLLRAEAGRRGLIEPGATLDAPAVFALVRDMLYERASSRAPETSIAEWRGTCSGKHYLLKALLEELGMQTILMMASHEFTPQNSPWLPPELMAMAAEAPVPDVHTFLSVQSDAAADAGGWTAVDATWPLAARDLGLPANERFTPGRDMAVAADVEELFHVPENVDPQQFKQSLVERHAAGQLDRRERFIEGLSRWLTAQLMPRAAPQE